MFIVILIIFSKKYKQYKYPLTWIKNLVPPHNVTELRNKKEQIIDTFNNIAESQR